MQDNFFSSGNRSERSTLINYSVHWATLLRQPGRVDGPSTLALGASQRLAYRELTGRVITVIVIVIVTDCRARVCI